MTFKCFSSKQSWGYIHAWNVAHSINKVNRFLHFHFIFVLFYTFIRVKKRFYDPLGNGQFTFLNGLLKTTFSCIGTENPFPPSKYSPNTLHLLLLPNVWFRELLTLNTIRLKNLFTLYNVIIGVVLSSSGGLSKCLLTCRRSVRVS